MKLIYILLILSLLTGCKVKKTLSAQSDNTTQRAEQKNIKQAEQIHTEINGNRQTESETVTEGVTVVYDTDKPTNPSTGKPPVKSETKWKQEAKEKGTEAATQTVQKDTQIQDKSHIDTWRTEQAKVEQKQEKDIFHIPWGWVALCLGLIATLLITLKYKKK